MIIYTRSKEWDRSQVGKGAIEINETKLSQQDGRFSTVSASGGLIAGGLASLACTMNAIVRCFLLLSFSDTYSLI